MEVKNNLIKKNEDINKAKFSVFLSQNAIKNKINEMVGSKEGQRFITSMLSVVSNNPKLAECNNTTILSSCLIGEALKLPMSPQLGYYYIIPYENTQTGESEAQFQIGYKGLIQLAIRTGQYKHINVVAIKQGELISYNLLTEELQTKFIEDDEIRENTETIGYYAMFETITGFKKSLYWSKKKMLLHADKYSQSFHINETTTKKGFKIVSFAEYEKNKSKYENSKLYSSNWYKNFDDMAFKTMLKQLLSKWGIMSVEMQEAVNKDMGVIREDGSVDYVDNLQNKDNKDNEVIDTQAEVKEDIKEEAKTTQEDLTEGFNMQEWKSKRLKGIGGSDASAILGLNPYMSNVDLWKIKTGKTFQEDISNKEVVKYGVAMEPILIEMFKVDNPQYEVGHIDYDIRYHKDYNFLFGSLDGYLTDKETGKRGVLEIKTCQINGSNYSKWKDKIPDNYYCQVLHYLLCTGWDFAIVFALLKHQSYIEIKKYDIQRKDVEEEINYLLQKELEFWNEYVLKNKEPPLILPSI